MQAPRSGKRSSVEVTMASALAFSTTEFLADEEGFIDLLQSGRISGGTPQSGEYEGSKALMLAVLEDAIRCFLGSQRLLRQEAEVWMSMRRQNWPFSFQAICEVLALEPSAVRRALVRMRERQVSGRRAIARSRPNGGRRTRMMGSRTQSGRRRRTGQSRFEVCGAAEQSSIANAETA
jgi:hypothetical protein